MREQADFAEFESLRVAIDQADAAATAELLCAARQEREYRSYRWTYMQKHTQSGDTTPVGIHPPGKVPGFFSLGRYYLAGLFFLIGIAIAVAVSSYAGAATGVTGLACIVAWQLFANHQRAKRLGSGECLKCGYDLRALRRAIEPAAVNGVDFGPLKCPECGREWPVIPRRDGSV